MSFLSKLFGNKPKADFIVHRIDFDVPSNQTLKDGEYLWATIDFESKHPCQVWLHPNSDDVFRGNVSGGYHPSDVYPAGRHTIKRWFYFNNLDVADYPNGLLVNGGKVIAQTEDGYTLHNQVYPTDCAFVSFSPDELKMRQNIDKDGLQIEFIKARITDSEYGYELIGLSPNDTVGMETEISVRIHAKCNDGVHFACFPRTDEEMNYGYNPMSKPLDGVLDLQFTMKETGKIKGFLIVAYNRYDYEIEHFAVDFPLIVEDWSDDGVGQEFTFAFDGIYDDEPNLNGRLESIKKDSTISANKGVRLYIHLAHQLKHGVHFKLYDVIDNKPQHLFCCNVLSQEYCQEYDGNPYFCLDFMEEELEKFYESHQSRQISGFYIVASNMVGEVLAEEVVDYPLMIVS
ncbi:MAG: hypothetical protein Q4B79_07415 [Moraxella sp.]|uniref:hypothetical protein n=1 Tax=Moraxella sp. TaxID=479 RepID=UPI0026DB6622|nr:hypothetical protein [Moraxella sp.]MDO4450766.1 hypothetical protein [Moraxella sp.]